MSTDVGELTASVPFAARAGGVSRTFGAGAGLGATTRRESCSRFTSSSAAAGAAAARACGPATTALGVAVGVDPAGACRTGDVGPCPEFDLLLRLANPTAASPRNATTLARCNHRIFLFPIDITKVFSETGKSGDSSAGRGGGPATIADG